MMNEGKATSQPRWSRKSLVKAGLLGLLACGIVAGGVELCRTPDHEQKISPINGGGPGAAVNH